MTSLAAEAGGGGSGTVLNRSQNNERAGEAGDDNDNSSDDAHGPGRGLATTARKTEREQITLKVETEGPSYCTGVAVRTGKIFC